MSAHPPAWGTACQVGRGAVPGRGGAPKMARPAAHFRTCARGAGLAESRPMLRRALLLLLLAAPLGALAVTESLTFSPTELGTKDCSRPPATSTSSWTVDLDTRATPSSPAPTSGGSRSPRSSGCPTSDTATGHWSARLSPPARLRLDHRQPDAPSSRRPPWRARPAPTTPDLRLRHARPGDRQHAPRGAVTGSIQYSTHRRRRCRPPSRSRPGDERALRELGGRDRRAPVAADHYEVTMTALDASGDPRRASTERRASPAPRGATPASSTA